MTGWQVALLIFVLVVVVGLAAWFIGQSVQHKKDLAEFASAPKDTTYSVDTLWVERVKIKTIHKIVLDTVYFPLFDSSQYVEPETTYVASCDTSTDRYRLHAEFGSPIPLSPLSAFQNISVVVKDSVRIIQVTSNQVEVVTEYPIPWFIAVGAVFGGLGYYLGTR